MIAPMAPLSCACCTLSAKVHVPRSITAIFPATGEADQLVSQPSDVVPTPSFTTTSWPESVNDCGPKSATPELKVGPPITATWALEPAVNTYICMTGLAPSLGVDMFE